jgi:transcriptional regulator with XRE-family HTH domain
MAEGGVLAKEVFGPALRDARIERGMSQADLSARSGLPKPTISRYENGHVLPSIPTLVRLAAAMSLRPSALLRAALGADPDNSA